MDYVYVGCIVNTHGIKGELKIISDFKYKDIVFKKGNILYIGKRKQQVIINSYRVHKNFDMVTFENINNINDAIIFKGDDVFMSRDNIAIDGFVNEDIIGLDVYAEDKLIGTVEAILNNSAQEILVVKDENHKHMIPYVDEFINDINLENKRIDINVIEGLLNEN